MQKEIGKAFDSTCEVFFGKKIGNISNYEKWLKRYVRDPIERESGGNTIYIPNMLYYDAIKERLVDLGQALELGKKHISAEDARSLTLANAAQKLRPIDTITSDAIEGRNVSVEQVAAYGLSHYCYSGTFFVQNKYCAYCFWPRQSEYVFGSVYLFSSKFCINCYYSSNLVRCFEVSDSNNCTDCYFCHNCENLDNCMFCFNVKSKRYAIANVEVGREAYIKIRKALIEDVTKKLEKEKWLETGIYNLGCGGKDGHK